MLSQWTLINWLCLCPNLLTTLLFVFLVLYSKNQLLKGSLEKFASFGFSLLARNIRKDDGDGGSGAGDGDGGGDDGTLKEAYLCCCTTIAHLFKGWQMLQMPQRYLSHIEDICHTFSHIEDNCHTFSHVEVNILKSEITSAANTLWSHIILPSCPL